MKVQYIPFFVAVLAFAACDESAVRKEAYDQGFADGQAEMKQQMARSAQPGAPGARGVVAARATPATPPPQASDPQIRRILPNSKLQGSSLDQKAHR